MRAKYLGPAGILDDSRNSGRRFRQGETVTMSRAEFERLTADTSIRFEVLDEAAEADEASEAIAGQAPAEAPPKRRRGRPPKRAGAPAP